MLKSPERLLTDEDLDLAQSYFGASHNIFEPDVILAPEGEPYLYRWYLSPAKLPDGSYPPATIMFHIQVQSDPERPLHDHPWDNQSVILSGSYVEIVRDPTLVGSEEFTILRSKGSVITRRAEIAHRLILPKQVPYTMTLFTAGPKVREWGFWYPDGWHHNKRHVNDRNGVSTHVEEPK